MAFYGQLVATVSEGGRHPYYHAGPTTNPRRVPADVRGLQRRLIEFVQAGASLLRINCEVVPTGSIVQGTDTASSDADVYVNTGSYQITRADAEDLAQYVSAELKVAYPNSRISYEGKKKGKQFTVYLWDGTILKGDVTFGNTTWAPLATAGNDMSRFGNRPGAREAVRMLKEMQDHYGSLTDLSGYVLEGLALAADHQPNPRGAYVLGTTFCKTLRLLYTYKNDLHGLYKLVRPFLPLNTTSFMTAGELINWGEHAGRELRAMQQN